jgi:hypothetical protein
LRTYNRPLNVQPKIVIQAGEFLQMKFILISRRHARKDDMLVADRIEGWSPAVRRSGPVFSTPVRPASALLSPAAMLTGSNRLQDGRRSLSPALEQDLTRYHQTVLDASVASLQSDSELFDKKLNLHHKYLDSCDGQKAASRLLGNSIVEISAKEDCTGTLSGSPPSVEVEVAEDDHQLLAGHPVRSDSVAVWRRELRERSEPECLTYLQSRPVRQQLQLYGSCGAAAGQSSSSCSCSWEQDWIRTLQDSGRRVLSTIKAFKRYAKIY